MTRTDTNNPSERSATSPRIPSWLTALLVAAAFFAAVAPTLPWLEFAGGSENLVVQTVLEMRRGGPWFIPTLQGYPRVAKPPWTAWLTAAAAKPETVRRLSTPDPAVRYDAFREFAWQVRWPTLLSACAMLAAAYALGETLFGRPVGLVAALACGSNLLFLRFCRGATTDVQLALWATVANAFLAAALLRGRHWLGFTGAGVALGLAFMSKGPVAFIQTVLPFALLLVWRRFQKGQGAAQPDTRPGNWLAAVVGFVLMLAVALPWYVAVVLKDPNVLGPWVKEVTREGATQLAADPWYIYFVFFLWTAPWVSFVLAGLWLGALAMTRRTAGETPWREREALVASLLLTIVPLLVMSFVKDKNERYALPMIAPAAVLAAAAAVGWWRSGRRDPAGRVVEAAHWATLLGMAVGLPAVGLLSPRLGLGATWFGAGTAAALAGVALALALIGIMMSRRAGRPVPAAVATAAVMLLLQYPVMRWYSGQSVSDLRPLADVVWARYPDAVLYEYQPGTRTRTYLDLPIYAGRISRTLNDPPALPQTDRPQVVVYFDRRSEGLPPPPPPWQEVATGGGRKDRWRAYVLPANLTTPDKTTSVIPRGMRNLPCIFKNAREILRSTSG